MSFLIHGAQLSRGHTVEIDEYVPLTIQWPGYARLRQAPQSVVVDVGASSVEAKTDRDSGEVVELALVDMGRPEDSDAALLLPGVTESSVPLMSYDEASQDSSASGVHLHSDGLRIRFAQERAFRAVGDTEAVFGFSEMGHLVEFDVRLGLERMAQLRAVYSLG
ncbi:hypothetical protein [Streptomyces violaceus]|uniref:Uncharacterized protein n=1 Tax=Streptomyces violaceus TaxID=1936 RepID=A0ABY9UL82_STRVL|nr:hypothetical protein [Streptomyces janthinus]WND23593.1 hypothetical protein RI060_42520 [Streptomyces janthinus]GGS95612.1 hypothetical protein GCM10010270_79470 [Streptomyces janthinus]